MGEWTHRRLGHLHAFERRVPSTEDTGLSNVEVWRGQHSHHDEQLDHGAVPLMRPLGEHVTVQLGAFGSIQKSFSSLYPDINLLTFNTATFSQIEWAKGGWKVAGGVRAERNFFPSIFDESSGPIMRLGLNRELSPTTNLRMSYGESLRFASLAERYVEGSLGDNIDIIGNVDLISESGNNWEIGLVQEVKGEGVSLLLEAAVFVLNYDEMIEYTLLPQVDSNNAILFTPEGDPMFFFKPLNLGQTRIAGFELSASGDAKIAGVPFRTVGIHVQLRR